MAAVLLLLGLIAGISAFASDPVISKWGEGPRFSYLQDDSGVPHLVDNWLRVSDVARNARYNPDASNVYHLYTRRNPGVSQPLLLNQPNLVHSSNFDARRRSIVLMHGFMGSASADSNAVLVPAFLVAEDCNVLVLDWSAGSYWGPRAAEAGRAGGRFINWLNSLTGSNAGQFHVVGYSVGGHGAGHIGRTVNGNVAYITALDPAERWEADQWFRPNDGTYTEVIHTSDMGEQSPLGQVDFYPNEGRNNPGCITSLCDHMRSYYFLAESVTSGGFTGTRCLNLAQALSGTCNQPGNLRMGGLQPKNGQSGIFHLRTNTRQPFSQG